MHAKNMLGVHRQQFFFEMKILIRELNLGSVRNVTWKEKATV